MEVSALVSDHLLTRLTSLLAFQDADNVKQVLQILAFIKQTINEFGLSSLKSIFEYLFRLLALNSVVSID
jgi:hypothetical protein